MRRAALVLAGRTALGALALLLAGASVPGRCPAAPAAAPPPESIQSKERIEPLTLPQMIARVREKGRDEKLEPPLTEALDWHGSVATKMVRYSDEWTPDRRAHELHLVFRNDSRAEPVALVWVRTKLKVKDHLQHVDTMRWRTSLTGELQTAVRSSGKAGAIEHKRLDASSRGVRKDYRRELEFMLKDAVEAQLPLER